MSSRPVDASVYNRPDTHVRLPRLIRLGLDASFSPRRARRVLATIPQSATDAMAESFKNDLHMPDESSVAAANGMMLGEKRRLTALREMLRQFYRDSRDIVDRAGRELGISFSDVWEIGPSIGGAWAMLTERRQPSYMIGEDDFPPVVDGGNVVITYWQRRGLLRGSPEQNNYRLVLSGQEAGKKKPALRHASLVSMYGEDPGQMVGILMDGAVPNTTDPQETIVGNNNDVIHVANDTTPEQLAAGVLPLRSHKRPDVEPAIALRISGKSRSVAGMGDIYDAEIVINRNVIDGEKIAQIPIRGKITTRVTVWEERLPDGQKQLRYMGWAIEPTAKATETETLQMGALIATVREFFEGMGKATHGKTVYDAGAATALAQIAVDKGFQAAIEVSTGPTGRQDPATILAILKRYESQVKMVYEAGCFSRIRKPGEAPTEGVYSFANFQDYQNQLSMILNDTHLRKKFVMSAPVWLSTQMTNNPNLFNQMITQNT